MRRWNSASTDRRSPAVRRARCRIPPGSIPSCDAPASRWSCCTWSISASIPMAIGIRHFACTTGSGWTDSACRCGRCTRPARSCLSITPGRSLRWSTRRPGSCGPSSCLSPCWARRITRTSRRPTPSAVYFIQSHSHAVEYVGGVPAAIVPDQLRTGIRDPCRYEPILQRTYEECAAHYSTAIVPARPAKPRDKAKAEVGVQVAQRWVLARLRHETFFSLAALNARIRELLVDLSARPMKGYGGLSRRDLFERFDRPALRPLPTERFVYTEWRQARLNIDYR